MTAVLMFAAATAIMAGLVWLMVRLQRSHNQMIERRREEWRAWGSVGPQPGRGGCTSSGGTVNWGA